ncbi:MAG: hypothetical protein IJB10_03025 [Clostridia bacterium]|nr:hypothetical protein [Clostridia bacterium]
MINFNKNKLINETLDKYYETFSHMLDTSDYVPERFNNKIGKYIFKNMKKAFRVIDREDRKYQREFKRKYKERERLKKPKKDNFFKKLFTKIKRFVDKFKIKKSK